VATLDDNSVEEPAAVNPIDISRFDLQSILRSPSDMSSKEYMEESRHMEGYRIYFLLRMNYMKYGRNCCVKLQIIEHKKVLVVRIAESDHFTPQHFAPKATQMLTVS
jgi:hypothetical protein